MKELRTPVIVGGGMTKFGRREASFRDLISEAGKACFDNNKNIDPKDIDGFILCTVFPERSAYQGHPAPLGCEILGLRPEKLFHRVETQCGTGTIGIRDAYAAIASGLSDMCMVLGVEKLYCPVQTDVYTNMLGGMDREWEGCNGVTPAAMFSMFAQKHMEKYGTTVEQLAKVVVKNHTHANKFPYSRFYGRYDKEPITIDTVRSSQMVAAPLTVYDCCSNSDGGAAVIMTTEERAKDLTDKPMYILGTNQVCHGYTWATMYEDFSTFPAAKICAQNAYKMAGITPDDIDVVELHDCFSITEVILTEEFGFCQKGEGGRFVEAGLSDYGGKVVINPSGGLLGNGHPFGATGVRQAIEILTQLRGEAGERQVEGARIGMGHNLSAPMEQHIIIYGKERPE